MSSAADEKSSYNGDAAVDAVDSPAPIIEVDPAVERRVVRKLDCTVLIAFGLVFGESKKEESAPVFCAVLSKPLSVAPGSDSSVATCFFCVTTGLNYLDKVWTSAATEQRILPF